MSDSTGSVFMSSLALSTAATALAMVWSCAFLLTSIWARSFLIARVGLRHGSAKIVEPLHHVLAVELGNHVALLDPRPRFGRFLEDEHELSHASARAAAAAPSASTAAAAGEPPPALATTTTALARKLPAELPMPSAPIVLDAAALAAAA